MMITMTSAPTLSIQIAIQFSDTPGPRLADEGPFSGEVFRDQCLKPLFLEALAAKQKLLVDLDGTEGYATSFLEEAFGGLAREFGSAAVLQTLEFKSDEEPYLIDEIENYIHNSEAH